MASINTEKIPEPLPSDFVDSEAALSPETVNPLEDVAAVVSDNVEPFASLLPRLFALKCVANNRYMRCESEGDVGRLMFSVEGIIFEPRTRYEVELTSTEGVVHVRCTFNNKYLRRDSGSSHWVKALATEISEDTNRWDCTLFEVLPATQGAGQIRLRHVHLGYYLSMVSGGLAATATTPSDGSDRFTFINCSTLVILPRYVTFKGPNGKYLKTGWQGYLQFHSNDKREAGVTMEVLPLSDEYVKIMAGPGQPSLTFWMADNFRIYVSFLKSMFGDVSSPLQVVRDEGNRVSFKHLVRNKFCQCRDMIGGGPNLYVADASSITEKTKLVVEEAVMRRTLDIEWRLQDARVYNVVPYELNGSTHDNNSSSPVTKSVTLTYETEVTTSFEASHTWATGITTSIETPSIPFIGGGMQIEMSAEYGGSYTWGESTTNRRSYSETDTYTVPPRTRLVVQKLSTKGYCDVPYAYVQTDYLFNGDIIRSDKEDGVYKGVNYFNIHTSNRDEPLPQSLWVD
ncbi:hypothetical protein ACHQM5_012238 [Ranunculus cassubicifolius]